MTKKAVIITSYPYPGAAATANRVRSIASALVTECEFDILVVGVSNPQAIIKDIDNENFKTVSIRPRAFNKRNLLLRALGELKQVIALVKLARRQNADLFVITMPSMLLFICPFFLPKNSVIFDFRDIVWDYLIRRPGFVRVLGRILRFMVKKSLNKSIGITVTNKAEKEILEKMTTCPVMVIGNGISRAKFERLRDLKENQRGKIFRIVYVGNLGVAQHLETLLLAVGGDNRFQVKLIGSGTDDSHLKKIVSQSNMKNVSFLGHLAWHDTLGHIELADCLYGQIGQSFPSALPSKLFEYLVCGRAVVFGLPADGIARQFVARFHHVYVCEPNCTSELKDIFQYLRGRLVFTSSEKYENQNLILKSYIREEQFSEFRDFLNQYFKIQ